jgi:hypothetical protein
VPETTKHQLINEHDLSATAMHSEPSKGTELATATSDQRVSAAVKKAAPKTKPVRSKSTSSIPAQPSVILDKESTHTIKTSSTVKTNPTVINKVQSSSRDTAQVRDLSLPPHHPNKPMVKSASSPRPSRRLRRYICVRNGQDNLHF